MNQRLGRMADRIQRDIAGLIRSAVKDPRLNTAMVTVCAVKVSKDIGYADIYFTIMDTNAPQAKADGLSEPQQQAVDVLNKAAGFLRQELGLQLSTRTVPRLRFHYDTVTAQANYMAALIAQAVDDLPVINPQAQDPI